MGVHSGRWAVVNGASSVSAWQVNDTTDMKEAVASNTKAGKKRLPGPKSWTGSYEQFGGIPASSMMPGSMISFSGYEAPDNDTVGGTGVTLSGQAMIERLSVTWNWGTGDVLKMASEFLGHLGLSYADGQAAIFDSAVPNFPSTKQLPTPTVQVNNAGGYVNWPNLTTLTLTISNEVQSYVNSSTGGLTGRLAGIFDAEVSATEQEVLRSLFDLDNIIEFKLPVDATFTNFWIIRFGKVKEFTNIRMDRETGAIISRNVTIPWTAYDDENPEVVGQIRLPGQVTDWWPIAGS